MAHVTFVHGIANKVAAEALERVWLDALREGGGLDLRAEGVSSALCYWADLVYPEPLPVGGASAEAGEEADVLAAGEVGLGWLDALSPHQRAAVEELAAEVDALSALQDVEDDLPGTEPAGGFERLPLPGPLKRRLMRAFLRDVHLYLFDVEHAPRPGERHRVRTEVRTRLLRVLEQGAARPGPHLVLGHSLGSVVAYDVLRNVEGCPRVDTLLTVGSPLGLDEVQDRLQPGWSRRDGYPGERLGAWVNVFDRLDPVCGLDPMLGNDFRDGGERRVVDVSEASWGSWRHSIGKYLRGPQLRDAVSSALDLG